MIADEWSDQARDENERGNVETRLALDPAAGLTSTLDHDDTVEARPLMVLLKPVDVVDDGDVPGLDATVIAIDRTGAAHGSVLEIAGFLLGNEEFDIIAQRALIAFEGEDVVGLLVQDLLGDGTLADPMREVDSDPRCDKVRSL